MSHQMRRPVYAQSSTQWMHWCNVILGLILFISPWYSATTGLVGSSWSGWCAGAAIVLVSLWAMSTPGSPIPEWINILLGIWVFISPWVLGFAGIPVESWTAWVIGFLVVVFSAYALSQRTRPSALRI